MKIKTKIHGGVANWYRGQVNEDAFITDSVSSFQGEGDGVLLEKGEDRKRFIGVTDN